MRWLPTPICWKIFQWIHLREICSWSPTHLTKTNQFENTFNYQKLFYIKNFCDIFLTKIHLFHRPYVLILLERALFIKRKPFLLSYKEFSIIFIINGPLNIDWLASFSSYKILIGLFKLNEKPVKLLLTACYWL